MKVGKVVLITLADTAPCMMFPRGVDETTGDERNIARLKDEAGIGIDVLLMVCKGDLAGPASADIAVGYGSAL